MTPFMNITNREEIKKLLEVNDKFLIILSQADDDSLASGIMLKRILMSKGKLAKAIHHEEIPEKFNYIPFLSEIEIENPAKVDYSNYKVVIAVDAGSMKQIIGMENINTFAFPDNIEVLSIDHHLGNTGFAKYNIYESTASSATELVFRNFVEKVDDNDPFYTYIPNKDESTLFLIGIYEDTGFFKWSMNKYVFKIAARLLEYGGDTNYITNYLHYNKDMDLYKFLKYCIGNIKFYPDINFMLLVISKEDIQSMELSGKFQYTRDFHEMFTCAYKGFNAGGILTELEDKISGSFRGNTFINKVSLNQLCKNISLNGGGHFNSAGFDMVGVSLEECEKLVLENVKILFDNL